MATQTYEDQSLVEFEQASNEASDLAERIAKCGRSGGTHAEMTVLLKAWQTARHQARASHERMLATKRARSGQLRKLAAA